MLYATKKNPEVSGRPLPVLVVVVAVQLQFVSNLYMKDSPPTPRYGGRNNDGSIATARLKFGTGTISYVQAKGGEDVVG